MQLLLLTAFLTLPAGISVGALLTIGALLAGMALSHQGAFDASAAIDVMSQQAQVTLVALTASGVFPAGALSGSADVFCVNSTNTPGTVTTRTAAQMYADLTTALGFAPPAGYTYTLRITHNGTGTLTVGAGTGVTLNGTTTSVATVTWRDYIVTVNSPISLTIQTTGSGSQ